MRQDMASRLFALDGAEVAEVDEEPGGGRTVWLVTADPGARVCPGCQMASAHVREQVVTRPADIGYGRDQVRRGVGEAAVGVPGCFLPAQDVHRVAAGHPAAVPDDGAAA